MKWFRRKSTSEETVPDADLAHRDFLKKLASAGAIGAAVSTLMPREAQATYSNGIAPGGGDLVDTHLTVQGNLTIKGPNPWVDIRAYGADTAAADNTAAIQAAINAAGSDGGTVFFPAGTFKCTGSLSLDGKTGIQLMGARMSEGVRSPTLQYTGFGPAFLSLHSSSDIRLHGLSIQYDNTSFSGVLVDCDNINSSDTSLVRIEHCSFSGLGSAVNARACIRLNNTICSSVRNCSFLRARTAILGRDSGYSNAIQIECCEFGSADPSVSLSEANIKNGGEAWLISGCTFEPISNGSVVAYWQDPTPQGGYARGLAFVGNWFGDASAAGVCVTAKALGFAATGNFFAIGSPAASVCLRLAQSEGIHIAGNEIQGDTGIDVVAFAIGLSVIGNKFFGVRVPVSNLNGITPGTRAFLGNSGLSNDVQ
ncbi:MAG TPA: glycosyl hydrolase family 28-related protein [Thermoanaerobaculia bacterium]|jgi:hypothetical protein|nr:glycosyl hydrolase family 28-related protein [Thermoanaerobaculia bacterium]